MSDKLNFKKEGFVICMSKLKNTENQFQRQKVKLRLYLENEISNSLRAYLNFSSVDSSTKKIIIHKDS